jgi:hypothetical protein
MFRPLQFVFGKSSADNTFVGAKSTEKRKRRTNGLDCKMLNKLKCALPEWKAGRLGEYF